MTSVTGLIVKVLLEPAFINWQAYNWHYPVFAVAAIAILIGIRRYELSRIRLKNRMKIADIEIRKLKEIDKLKSRFFTNISHEFLAPLTLIKGSVEELIYENHNQKNRESLKLIHSNVTRLLELINQKMDLAKIESADDYLVKPFNAKELLASGDNIISSPCALREKYIDKSRVTPGGITVSSQDTAFMEKVLLVVYKNMDNSAFSVDDLAKGIGMSRSQLHRKLKSVTNMPANHFIRSVRMDRAMELLRKDAGNISEIAYMVGYDDPGYFTKSFRTYFGKLPTEIKRH